MTFQPKKISAKIKAGGIGGFNPMNSDFVMEQSRLIAERAQRESEGKSEQALARCFELLLGRKPTPREQESCSTLLRDGELNLICRAIINSNEFAFLP